MIKLIAFSAALLSCNLQANNTSPVSKSNVSMSEPAKSIYEFKVEGLEGGTIDFAAFKGKKILIVNTASKCGYTPQYEGLQKLYDTYKDKLVIVGFPANNFGGQEPGSAAEIQEFCKKNYGVSFPMAAKISVKGDDMAPIYKWLCNKTENGVLDAEVGWNFGKFLLDENGNLLSYFPSKVTPMSGEITSKL
ncbi:MAG: glutathione peroxidase [Chitinophagaceae bacterium]|nr:glutathione peroxidase [Chitinophagaceae bacterium]